MPDREHPLVEWLARRAGEDDRVPLGIGDDMAEVFVPDSSVLVSTDMLLDGVHFDSRVHPFDAIGRKALACCLSDCAAMAATPLAALVSVALSDRMSDADIRRLFDGIIALSEEYDVPIAGGDTTRWANPLAIDVSILAVAGERVVTRAGARVGDDLWVTGCLGGSLRGRHMNFLPRVSEAIEILDELGDGLHAMIDISDGLSLDLHRMCRASGVGALLYEEALAHAASEDADLLSREDGRSILDHVLTDGEDFELLMAVKLADAPVPAMHARIGEIVAGDSITLVHADGRREALEPAGYSHL